MCVWITWCAHTQFKERKVRISARYFVKPTPRLVIPTYRLELEKKIDSWKPFRDALRID